MNIQENPAESSRFLRRISLKTNPSKSLKRTQKAPYNVMPSSLPIIIYRSQIWWPLFQWSYAFLYAKSSNWNALSLLPTILPLTSEDFRDLQRLCPLQVKIPFYSVSTRSHAHLSLSLSWFQGSEYFRAVNVIHCVLEYYLGQRS